MDALMDAMRLAHEASHGAYREGVRDAKAELVRRLRQIPQDQSPLLYADAVCEVLQRWLEE